MMHLPTHTQKAIINSQWSISYKNIESPCCTAETNIVNQLYFSENHIKKF